MHPVDPADMVQLAPEGNRGLAAIDDAPVGCLCVLPWSIYSGILIDNQYRRGTNGSIYDSAGELLYPVI